MTEAQLRALRLLAGARDEDEAVSLGTTTGKIDGRFTVARRVARALVKLGYARLAEGGQRFLLATPGGLAAAGTAKATL